MRFYLAVTLLVTILFAGEKEVSLFDFEVETITHEKTTLSPYKGKVILVVNVASKCGYTPQYEGLEKLYEAHRDEGFVILGFPCNQFGHQEPGTEEEIVTFCRVNYGVSFPMFAKIDVNGEKAHPLYRWLKSQQAGIFGTEAIKWNFTKFLVDREGRVVARFSPGTKPSEIEKDVIALLKE